MTLLSDKQAAERLGICRDRFKKILQGKGKGEHCEVIRKLNAVKVPVKYYKSRVRNEYPEDAVNAIVKEAAEAKKANCARCKKEFMKNHSTQKFCSKECKVASDNVARCNVLKEARRVAREKRITFSPKKPSQVSQNPSQALAATKTPSKSSQKPQKAYSENKSNFFKSIQPTNEYGMPSDYQTGQQIKHRKIICFTDGCTNDANSFTGICSTCAIQSRYRQMQPIRMKGI